MPGGQDIVRAVAEGAEHAVDVVKVMASAGVSTPGSDVLATQFTDAELGLIVERPTRQACP